MTRSILSSSLVAAVVFGFGAAPASAQVVGIGPRLSFVRGDVTTGTPDTRFLGGTLRMRTSPRVAIELALDHRTQVSDDLTQQTRETPFQGSLLLFVSRGRFSPYVLGGFGIYTQDQDTLGADGLVASTVRTRKTGWHAGLGAEVFVARHAALYGDYRFRFIHWGDNPDPGAQPINVPFVDTNKLTHQGSMWTYGLAFYF
jgi:opacity protein-like surface antigen